MDAPRFTYSPSMGLAAALLLVLIGANLAWAGGSPYWKPPPENRPPPETTPPPDNSPPLVVRPPRPQHHHTRQPPPDGPPTTTSVPEPASLTLGALGSVLAGAAYLRRRKRRSGQPA